ncbi:TPA: hypothetical protein ACH3X2_008504 [Trebouxia sp. C0005]
MEPLPRPICFRCRDPAVNCKCEISSGKELLIPLVSRSEPTTREEGLDLWAAYIDRHPATFNVDVNRFVADTKTNGFLRALEYEADNFRSMVLDYAAADFPPIGSANIADKKKAATDALSLFLKCRWSKMSMFDLTLVHNSLGALYQPGLKLRPSLQLIADGMGCILKFMGQISLARSYGLEIYPPVFRDSFKQKVYSLSQPPAKASYNGLSVSAYESLITNLTKGEMYEASVVATICIQANVSIEEVLTWKMYDMKPTSQHYVTFKQEASRVGPKRDVFLPRLPNVLLCPMSLISMMSVARVSEASLMGSILNRQAANVYLIHDPDSLVKPLTPNNIKRQLVKGLAKMNIHALPYEVQSLLSATHVRCGMNAYNIKEPAPQGRRCEICKQPAPLKCGKCREVSYCSKECQAKDWKAGHKVTCGV